MLVHLTSVASTLTSVASTLTSDLVNVTFCIVVFLDNQIDKFA